MRIINGSLPSSVLYRFCPRCKDHVCAENTTFIDKLPDVLVLQLERFEFTQDYYYSSNRRKITSFIDFPIHDLNMKEWVYGAEELGEDAVYDLKAVCNHTGSSSGGHYFCYACDENDGEEMWHEYNDSSVFPISDNTLARDTAYVLFYERRSTHQNTHSLIQAFESMIEKEGTAVISMKNLHEEIDSDSDLDTKAPNILVSAPQLTCQQYTGEVQQTIIAKDSIDDLY